MNGFILSAVLLAAAAQVAVAYPGGALSFGTAGPVCTEEGEMIADSTSLCWYHQCIMGADDRLYTIPRRCALGSKLSYYYTYGFHNPCTINHDSTIGYECDKGQQSADIEPPCASDGSVVCYNGGTLTYEDNRCWCLCPLDMEGDFDCSKPTGFYDALEANAGIFDNSICVDGQPQADFCADVGGCENGGECYNQCDTFWCDCPKDESYVYYGKRCETSKKRRK